MNVRMSPMSREDATLMYGSNYTCGSAGAQNGPAGATTEPTTLLEVLAGRMGREFMSQAQPLEEDPSPKQEEFELPPGCTLKPLSSLKQLVAPNPAKSDSSQDAATRCSVTGLEKVS
eukprot:gnl/MRDRNA2_/MRDRNA2_93486_c0_seq1.p1 gnl/MRDRNA2_/MRDRNA2_93486_c0~~gnl/MRDRNA2_/MRDRNA2_93486_c0_seq1.p1  ORF type:complete len:117 (+),score=26.77 gnl/MRDRNA2_/MRDRNA2_93486_c0_seq1:60-410(+)